MYKRKENGQVSFSSWDKKLLKSQQPLISEDFSSTDLTIKPWPT